MAGKAPAKENKKTKRAPESDPQGGKETLLLWAILGEGGGKDVSRAVLEYKGMLPGDDKKARDGLEARGLIAVEQRTTRNEQGKSVRGTWMTVTKDGLAWAEENLAVMPAKSQAATPILQAWLARLSILLQARNTSMSQFLEPHCYVATYESRESPVGVLHEDSPAATFHPEPSPLNGDYDTLRARIRQAYLAITGNRVNTRARLHDIREKLHDIDPVTLEAALKRMQREQQATLYPLDNKAEITDADRNAAIYFGSEPRHILWIER
jgi:hypothetical protein